RVIVQSRGANLTLEQELHAAQTTLNLADPADHAHRVKLLGGWFVHVLALRYCKDQPVSLECRLDGTQCSRPPDPDGNGDPGKDGRSTQRQDRQASTFRHSGRLPPDSFSNIPRASTWRTQENAAASRRSHLMLTGQPLLECK